MKPRSEQEMSGLLSLITLRGYRYFPNEIFMNRSLCADGNFLNYHEEKRSDVEDWQLDQEKVKIISTK